MEGSAIAKGHFNDQTRIKTIWRVVVRLARSDQEVKKISIQRQFVDLEGRLCSSEGTGSTALVGR